MFGSSKGDKKKQAAANKKLSREVDFYTQQQIEFNWRRAFTSDEEIYYNLSQKICLIYNKKDSSFKFVVEEKLLKIIPNNQTEITKQQITDIKKIRGFKSIENHEDFAAQYLASNRLVANLIQSSVKNSQYDIRFSENYLDPSISIVRDSELDFFWYRILIPTVIYYNCDLRKFYCTSSEEEYESILKLRDNKHESPPFEETEQYYQEILPDKINKKIELTGYINHLQDPHDFRDALKREGSKMDDLRIREKIREARRPKLSKEDHQYMTLNPDLYYEHQDHQYMKVYPDLAADLAADAEDIEAVLTFFSDITQEPLKLGDEVAGEKINKEPPPQTSIGKIDCKPLLKRSIEKSKNVTQEYIERDDPHL